MICNPASSPSLLFPSRATLEDERNCIRSTDAVPNEQGAQVTLPLGEAEWPELSKSTSSGLFFLDRDGDGREASAFPSYPSTNTSTVDSQNSSLPGLDWDKKKKK